MNDLSLVYFYIMRFVLFIFLLMIFCMQRSDAQSIWNNINDTKKSGTKKLEKTGSGLKQFKKHLQDWGLDSNYTKAFALGVRLNTNGWSGLLYYQKKFSKTQSRFYQLSFSEVKHEKQIKQQKTNKAFPELGVSTPFVFGKINNLYTLQLGIGQESLLLPGVLEDNISLSLRTQIGFSLAMLKPYYLRLIYVDYINNTPPYVQEEKYSEENSEQFLKASNILGANDWSKGLDEMKYVPGGFIDIAFAIEPLKNKSFIKTVTFGWTFAVYPEKLPVMADQDAHFYQGSLYVGLNLGKRWK